MKSCLSAIFAFVVIIALIILGNSYFVVNEGQKAIVTRFGAPMGDIREPGLNFKTPFIEDVIYFDTRILKWDGEPNQIPTKEKNYIWIDCTARWRIKDPLLYYKKLGNINSAQSKLDDIIDSVVRDR
ncbi:MAG: protease modulator HflC, partial [Candidatus Riflebacteria bacterium]|nr:protease modulator HflC [Candidatus Riflebacteria bacterium]